MKKTSKKLLTLLLAATLALSSLSACGQGKDAGKTATQTIENTQPDGLWATATYQEDTELGEGAKTLTVEVKAEEKTVTFTVHTDGKTVGEALISNNLIAGDESEYGLYVKKVNGITADYDVDQSYWAFYVDGEYAMSGVDTTDIVEGSVYKLEYSK